MFIFSIELWSSLPGVGDYAGESRSTGLGPHSGDCRMCRKKMLRLEVEAVEFHCHQDVNDFIASFLVAQWLDRWCANLAAQI